VDTQPTIRQLVEQALYYRQITPEIENGINELLARLGYVSDVDYEALELLMGYQLSVEKDIAAIFVNCFRSRTNASIKYLTR